MTIRILTAIHPGIYASHGGGKTHVVSEASTGPRNLLRLAAQLDREAETATRCYGNVGHCGTWIEIDGVKVAPWDLFDLCEADPVESHIWGYPRKTRTQKSARLIHDVQSGEYVRNACALEASIRAADEIERAALESKWSAEDAHRAPDEYADN